MTLLSDVGAIGVELWSTRGADLGEPFERSCIVVPLSRSVIETASDGIALSLRQGSQRGALRQVLTNQAVRVLVRTALPRVIWGREVELELCALFDLFEAVELCAVVGGDGLE